MHRKIIGFLWIISLFAYPRSFATDTLPSLEEKIGQMFIISLEGTSVNENSPIVKEIKNNHIGGIVLFHSKIQKIIQADGTPAFEKIGTLNIESPTQLKQLISDLQIINSGYSSIPLFIAIDQEGGQIAHLNSSNGFPTFSSHKTLGKVNDLNRTYLEASLIANTLKKMGINLNLAPVADLAINPSNKVIYQKDRSFGSDPVLVAKHIEAFISAHRQNGIICTIKHFPGHGNTNEDSHFGLPDASLSWTNLEILPYKWIIEKNVADAIMTAHIYNQHLDSQYPATLSRVTLQGLLRQELQFDGLIISDDIQMDALSKNFSLEEILKNGIQAGVDIFLIAHLTEHPRYLDECVGIIKDLIQKEEIDIKKIDCAYNRIIGTKKKFNLLTKE